MDRFAQSATVLVLTILGALSARYRILRSRAERSVKRADEEIRKVREWLARS